MCLLLPAFLFNLLLRGFFGFFYHKQTKAGYG